MSKFIITADTTPLLDTFGFADYWENEDWQNWARLNVKKYNKSIARAKFIDQWGKQDTFAHNYNWAKYDKVFVDYIKKTINYDISNPLSSIVVGVDKVVTGAGNAVGSVGEGVGKAGKVTKYILPVFLVIVAITIIYVIYLKFIKQ